MRIAYVCGDAGIPVLGDKGAAVHVRELIAGLASLGHEVTLFAARTGRGPLDELSATLVAVTPEPDDARVHDDVVRAREWQQVGQHDAWMDALACRHRDTPFDLVYERYSLWARAGSAFARRHRLPHLVEVNSPLRAEQRRYRALAWDARAARVEQVVMGGATAVVAVSDEVARYVRSRTPRPDSVHVVENGVDLARYAGVPPYRRGERFQVGFLGSLKPWHGVDVLIAAAAIVHEQVPDLSLLVVGDGPERASLERLAHERGLGDVVQFTGSVPKRDVPARLATMDVAVAPYPQLDDFYFSPLKIYDYLAAGRPIVASRAGQIPHVLRDGDTAVLVPAGSIDHLASAILRLHRSPALAERLGRAARADAVARHGWDAKARHILGLAARNATPATHLPTKDALSWHAE